MNDREKSEDNALEQAAVKIAKTTMRSWDQQAHDDFACGLEELLSGIRVGVWERDDVIARAEKREVWRDYLHGQAGFQIAGRIPQ